MCSIQFGVTVPFRGWALDAGHYQTYARNWLDHSNIGESNLFWPLTWDAALIQGWELTLRSPRLWHRGQFHLAYANQIALSKGPFTGGLICPQPPASRTASRHRRINQWTTIREIRLNVGFNASFPGSRSPPRMSTTARDLRTGCRTRNIPGTFICRSTPRLIFRRGKLRRKFHRFGDGAECGESPRPAGQQPDVRRISLQRSEANLWGVALEIPLLKRKSKPAAHFSANADGSFPPVAAPSPRRGPGPKHAAVNSGRARRSASSPRMGIIP